MHKTFAATVTDTKHISKCNAETVCKKFIATFKQISFSFAHRIATISFSLGIILRYMFAADKSSYKFLELVENRNKYKKKIKMNMN